MKFLRLAALLAALLAVTPGASGQLIVYDNTASYKGTGSFNGGATTIGTNTITIVEADDITPLPIAAGQSVTSFTFSIGNFNPPTASFSFRPRVRFWDSNGPNGGPGTLLGAFDFSVTDTNTVPGGNAAIVGPNPLSPGQLVLPAGTFWAGVTFDNSDGAATATAAQLNNLGQAIFDPPTVGSSQNHGFDTTAAGSNAIDNPPGAFFTSSNPSVPINFGWQFQIAAVPEPGSLALTGVAALAGLGVWRRRRKA
jgi:hypothetical protein